MDKPHITHNFSPDGRCTCGEHIAMAPHLGKLYQHYEDVPEEIRARIRAHTCPCTYHYCFACSNTEDHALCSLHAAAPALLEALEAMLKQHAVICEDTANDLIDDDCEKARAAIRAAKGEGS